MLYFVTWGRGDNTKKDMKNVSNFFPWNVDWLLYTDTPWHTHFQVTQLFKHYKDQIIFLNVQWVQSEKSGR